MREKKARLWRVTMEPDLERMAAGWAPSVRLEMAARFRRWARQLRLSAVIALADQRPPGRPRKLRPLPAARLVRN